MKKIVFVLLTVLLTIVALTGCAGKTKTTPEAEPKAKTVKWPEKAITVIVPAKAGGGTDILARNLTKAWEKTLGQPIAVTNYDNGDIAMAEAKNAAKDGYTLFLTHTGPYISYITGQSDTSLLNDFETVGVANAGGDQAIVANPKAPFNNMTEMITYAKAHPGELSTGVAINGMTHFIWGLIAMETGTEFKYVQAASETDKLTNVAGGFIDLGNVVIPNAKQYSQAGKIKILGLISGTGKDDPELLKLGDNWKTLQSQGINAPWSSSFYVFAPKGTDPAILEAINASLKPAYDDPDYQKGLANMGVTGRWHSLKDTKAAIDSEGKVVVDVAKKLGNFKRE